MKPHLTLPTLALATLASCAAPENLRLPEATGQISGRVESTVGPLGEVPATTCHECHDDHLRVMNRKSTTGAPFDDLSVRQDVGRTIATRLDLGDECLIEKIGESRIAKLEHAAGNTNQRGALDAFRVTLHDGRTIDALALAVPTPDTTNQTSLFMVFPGGELPACTLGPTTPDNEALVAFLDQ